MNLQEYDKGVQDTNLMDDNFLYFFLGIMSEVGETANALASEDKRIGSIINQIQDIGKLAGIYKKRMRDHGEVYHYEGNVEEAKREIMDQYWYVPMQAIALGSTSEEMVSNLLKKLQDRKVRDVLKGSGDFR